MINTDKIVKIYDTDNNLIGKGHLLNLSSNIIRVKGDNLPFLDSKTKIVIEIYNELSGIHRYHCHVRLATNNQLNAQINKIDPVTERRRALKVRTDLSFYVDTLYRNDEDITKYYANMKINLLNLSIGGMLISSNYELYINDIITFNFKHEICILLKAKVIRIDKKYDDNTKQLSYCNYGCIFENMSNYCEDIITNYLYKRQLILYKDK